LPGAPVSTPLHWEELASLESPNVFDLHAIPQRVVQNGDPWEAIAAYATAIHTESKETAQPRKNLKPGRTHKTPEQLEDYSKKRSFDKTPEPPAAASASEGSLFVIHRHHATRLHYDLR